MGEISRNVSGFAVGDPISSSSVGVGDTGVVELVPCGSVGCLVAQWEIPIGGAVARLRSRSAMD